jgi:hypothetical protein
MTMGMYRLAVVAFSSCVSIMYNSCNKVLTKYKEGSIIPVRLLLLFAIALCVVHYIVCDAMHLVTSETVDTVLQY